MLPVAGGGSGGGGSGSGDGVILCVFIVLKPVGVVAFIFNVIPTRHILDFNLRYFSILLHLRTHADKQYRSEDGGGESLLCTVYVFN